MDAQFFLLIWFTQHRCFFLWNASFTLFLFSVLLCVGCLLGWRRRQIYSSTIGFRVQQILSSRITHPFTFDCHTHTETKTLHLLSFGRTPHSRVMNIYLHKRDSMQFILANKNNWHRTWAGWRRGRGLPASSMYVWLSIFDSSFLSLISVISLLLLLLLLFLLLLAISLFLHSFYFFIFTIALFSCVVSFVEFIAAHTFWRLRNFKSNWLRV